MTTTTLNELAPRLQGALRRIEGATALDVPANVIAPVVQRLTRPDAVKNLLSGTPFGHRLHPVLTDVPIGAWLSASILDVVGGRKSRTSARRLVGIGIVAALPTAASGLADWSDTHGATRRVGLVHAWANSAALVLQFASWSARRRDRYGRGRLLSALAMGAVGAGGYLGGHLVYARRAGVDADVPLIESPGWHVAARDADLLEGQPMGVDIEDARVLLVRVSGRAHALAAVCSHAGGPLDKGNVNGTAIECPWHKSRFCVRDGSIERGPATTPQVTYATRVHDGMIEVRSVTSPDLQD